MLTIKKRPEHDYSQLKEKWLKSHFTINVFSVILVFVAELIIFLTEFTSDTVTLGTIEAGIYALKYLIVPSGTNLVLLAVQFFVVRSKRILPDQKALMLSFGLACSCLIVSIVHSYFPVMMLVMAIPVIVSVIYGDTRLTNILTWFCVASDILSRLFIKYDSDTLSPLEDPNTLINFFLSLVVMACIFTVCAKVLKYENERLELTIKQEQERKMLQNEARTDALTGLYNRHALNLCCSEMIEDTDSNNLYAVVMADIDGFKNINDTFGHVLGDSALTKIGTIIRDLCREGLAFRYGGDEFCMIYKNVSVDIVKKDCEDMLAELENTTDEGIKKLNLNISFGIVTGKGGTSPFKLIELADEQLYRSKRNKCRLSVRY